MSDLECPYCGAENEVCHDDGIGYSEDEAHEMECGTCEKNFVFYATIHFHYSPRKADCLNGSPHQLREWRKIYTEANGYEIHRRCCNDCQYEERKRVDKKDGGEA